MNQKEGLTLSIKVEPSWNCDSKSRAKSAPLPLWHCLACCNNKLTYDGVATMLSKICQAPWSRASLVVLRASKDHIHQGGPGNTRSEVIKQNMPYYAMRFFEKNKFYLYSSIRFCTFCQLGIMRRCPPPSIAWGII